jgi:hypothetical protein
MCRATTLTPWTDVLKGFLAKPPLLLYMVS